MKNFFKDLVRNEFGSTVMYYRGGLKGLLNHLMFIWCVFLVIAIVTGTVSLVRYSKNKIDIELAYYEETADSCQVTYTIENRNTLELSNCILQYKVKDKNTGKVVYSDREYVGDVNITHEGDKDYFTIRFRTLLTDNDGQSYRVPYTDMIITYKVVEAQFKDDGLFQGVALYMITIISTALVCLPLVYYLGKFAVVVFPICLYAHTYNIENFFLRILVRMLFFLPYLWGGMFYDFRHPEDGGGLRDGRKWAVDANGRTIGIYNPKTHEVTDHAGRIIVPIQKK